MRTGRVRIRAALIGLVCVFGAACSTILGIGDPTVASDGGAVASQDGPTEVGDSEAGGATADDGDGAASADQTLADRGPVAPAMTGALDGGSPTNEGGGDARGGCTTTATQPLIDDMSATTGVSLVFPPPACSWHGSWVDWSDEGGVIANPPNTPASPALPMAFSPLPAGIPADAGGPASRSAGDGGGSAPRAACIVGATGSAAYRSAGMGIWFGYPVDAGDGPLQVDARSYTGIQFWAWGGADAGTQRVSVSAVDKNETAGFGVCDPTKAHAGATACGGATTDISMIPGWQLVQVPFARLAVNPYYGGGNEAVLDPSSLTQIYWDVELGPDGGAPLSFDFCLYDVAFYSGTGDANAAIDAGPDAGARDGSSLPPSCAAGGAGLSNCGASSESCCTSLEVPDGTFYRTYDEINWPDGGLTLSADGGATGEADPATVNGFRLDKYLVTVGRFRQYVDYLAGSAGAPPSNASGIHTHLNGGLGLANGSAPGSYEPGWDAPDWNQYIATGAGAASAWNANLACDPIYATWTSAVGSHENLPINCVNWYEAYAFCIWDGGFLPSQAEWEYAAAGGSQQLEYPWGSTDPGTGSQYAIYACYYPNGSGTCTGLENIAPVGAATLGVATWGQLDMAGELYEWTLGWNWTPPDPCTNCEVLGAFGTPPARAVESSPFIFFGSAHLPTPFGHSGAPAEHFYVEGVRCARIP